MIDYNYYDLRADVHNRKCIDGSLTGSCKCVGYCTFEEHSGFLTKKIRRQHHCLENNCHYYLAKANMPHKNKQVKPTVIDRLLKDSRELVVKQEGVELVKAKEVQNNYIIQFVAITNMIDLKEYAERLSCQYGTVVRFERLMYDFDKCVQLILNRA